MIMMVVVAVLFGGMVSADEESWVLVDANNIASFWRADVDGDGVSDANDDAVYDVLKDYVDANETVILVDSGGILTTEGAVMCLLLMWWCRIRRTVASTELSLLAQMVFGWI